MPPALATKQQAAQNTIVPTFIEDFGDDETGKVRVTFETRLFTITRVRKIAEVIGQARSERSRLHEFPMEPGESLDAWEKRIGKKVDEAGVIRNDDESVDEHILRISTPKLDAQEMGIEIIHGILEAVGLRKLVTPASEEGPAVYEGVSITLEQYNATNWLRVKNFIFKTLQEADIVAPEFSPKRKEE